MLFRNEKGQTFDVFKLLISAIIAGVILTVLLSIIQSGPIIPGQSPSDLATAKLKEAYSTGTGSLLQSNLVSFSNQAQLNPSTLAENADLVSEQVCVSSGDATNASKFSVNSDGIVTYIGSGTFRAKLSVLCDDSSRIADTLQGNEDLNPGASNWTNDCSSAWTDNCNSSGTGTCCIVAIRKQ